uniref:Tumor necrosis factor receptor superfamily member 5 n=1 Tax=Pseudonaja textilis TaxID=8673 RepID=A0A670ZSE3_PSETE
MWGPAPVLPRLLEGERSLPGPRRLGEGNGGGGAHACGGLAFAQGPSCSNKQYQLKDGRCCNRCPPGEKVAAACSAESNTTCSPCEEGHFQASWTKELHCTQHHTCNLTGLTVYENGTEKQDFICRCREGTHCSSPECETCKPHTSCGAGEGAQREGEGSNHLHDTLCAPCSLGSFSNVSSSTARCQPWSRYAGRGTILEWPLASSMAASPGPREERGVGGRKATVGSCRRQMAPRPRTSHVVSRGHSRNGERGVRVCACACVCTEKPSCQT